MGIIACPSCDDAEMEIFYEVKSVPTNSCILLSSPEEAKNYPRGDIDLGFCPKCGFISNTTFDEKLTEYSGRYEETQGFSGTFNKFHRELAERLIDRYDLHGKEVLEIGCGKGEFITLLSELGNNRGVGFDPGYDDQRNMGSEASNVTFIKDFYSEKYTSYKADFICCKMTLEHIHQTSDFIITVKRSIGDNNETKIFFQIPESTRILKDCAFEDIYYEHCSYFTPGSLARLFRKAGFKVVNIETEYDDQYLTIEAIPDGSENDEKLAQENDLKEVTEYVRTFKERCNKTFQLWEERLNRFKDNNSKVVLWGSGSKGVSFLTSLDVGNYIEYVVDINPHRQGYYMAGTGQKIVGPDFLKEYKPDSIIIMNPIYKEEISRDLSDMGLSPEIITL
jgi:SAM-dependent methyltransferase